MNAPAVWLTADEAAARKRLSHWTIRRWVKAGILAATRLPGGALRIRIEDIDAVGEPAAGSGEADETPRRPVQEQKPSAAKTGKRAPA